jgi:hydroxymethylbilane synthase
MRNRFTPLTKLLLGTRGSELALEQTRFVIQGLSQTRPQLEVSHEVIKTTGDARQDLRLTEAVKLADKGIFIKELEAALEEKKIDAAVHSLKDVPSELAAPYFLAAVLPRAAVEDVLITRHNASLMTLPAGATVGTSSVRRACQVRHLRPDLKVVEIRGNVPTRIRKCLGEEPLDAVILAAAGLTRLNLLDVPNSKIRIDETELNAEILDCQTFLPAAGQGAIALETLRSNSDARGVLRGLNHEATEMRVTAEREFLRCLNAGCHTPIGVHTWIAEHRLHMKVRVFAEKIPQLKPIELEDSGPSGSPITLARRMGEQFEMLKHKMWPAM